DEIDVVKDIDDLIYTLVRANDEIKKGGLSIIGISNKLGFKADLDPRSRSSLYEREIIFPPYDARQLKGILLQRVKLGFKRGSVSSSAASLIAAITAQENGDARYALKLLQTAGEIAESSNHDLLEEKHVEMARRQVEYDIAAEAMRSLPMNHQLVLYSLAKLTLSKNTALTMEGSDNKYFFSGDLYEAYCRVCRQLRKKAKSARSYRDYINELESLGLISTVFTSKGIKGHTRLIRIGHNPEDVISIVERVLDIKQ
ncbi:MAG: cell division control protein Cdc6, partial [Methanobacteriota archaeon]